MLLRRITEHVKAQNWTAVALDFVIVVVGVFIGIQVANGNERLAERRLGEDYLRGFHADLMADSKMLQSEIEGRRRQFQEAKAVLEYFDGRTMELDAFFREYYGALRARSTRPNRNTMDELLNSGNLRLIHDAEIRTDLLDLYAMYERIADFEHHIARDIEKYLYDTTFTRVPFHLEQQEDGVDNSAAAETLLGDVTIENGFRLIVANLQYGDEGLITDLEAARDQVDDLLHELASD